MYQTPSQQNKSIKVWYQWVEIEFNLGGQTNKSKKYRKLQLQLLFNLSLSLSLSLSPYTPSLSNFISHYLSYSGHRKG